VTLFMVAETMKYKGAGCSSVVGMKTVEATFYQVDRHRAVRCWRRWALGHPAPLPMASDHLPSLSAGNLRWLGATTGTTIDIHQEPARSRRMPGRQNRTTAPRAHTKMAGTAATRTRVGVLQRSLVLGAGCNGKGDRR
jgi:hypothetical protein